MDRTIIRQLIDASLGISYHYPNPHAADLHEAEATQKPPVLSPETPVLATEPESDPSPPSVAGSDGTGVE